MLEKPQKIQIDKSEMLTTVAEPDLKYLILPLSIYIEETL